MKKLPAGISNFREIITENYVYVDKTHLINRLYEAGKYYFLSRPRRFGKSLLIDTLAEAFSGNKKLFKGLHLENIWDWDVKSPVLKFSFGGGVIKNASDLDKNIHSMISELEALFQISTDAQPLVNLRFRSLIIRIREKTSKNVVILIDEYDKPILDNILNTEISKEIREGLKNFYSVIKDCDAFIRFCFLTGVTKFSKVSLFSGLNNLTDITLDPRFSEICGYTQQELEHCFSDWLQGIDRNELKNWYNGYNFLGVSVYNPYDILLFFSSGRYQNYWFQSGTPSFLISLTEQKQYSLPDFEHIEVNENLLDCFDVENISLETLLFQTGYLTIKQEKMLGMIRKYQLKYPNFEVKTSLCSVFLDHLVQNNLQRSRIENIIYDSLATGNPEKMKEPFHSFFASIPGDWYRKNYLAGYEGYYASIFYCYFAALGLDVTAEDCTNHGRLDLSVKLDSRVYIFEFKVVESAGRGGGMAQLKEKKYHEKFSVPEKYLVSVEFQKTDRNISSFEWEKLGG